MIGALRLAAREARAIARERTIVLALVVQLFVAAFSTFLAVGVVALYEPDTLGAASPVRVGYAGEGDFDDQLGDRASIDLVAVGPREGREAFADGRLDALAVETAGDESRPRRLHLRVPEDEMRTTLVVNELKAALDDYEHQLRLERGERIEGEVLRVEGPERPPVSFTFVYGALLPLLVAAPAFLSGAITADSLGDEINQGTLLALQASPLSPGEIVLGKLLVPVALVPAQVTLWMGLLALNGLPVASPLVVLGAATALGAVLSAVGVGVAALLRREGAIQAGYTLTVLALAGLSLALPQDPANLVARAGVGTLTGASWVTLGVYGVAAAALTAAAAGLVADRLAGGRLRPGVA